jgi:hypothetical protein
LTAWICNGDWCRSRPGWGGYCGVAKDVTEAMRDDLKVRVARQGELSWQLARLETEWLELAEAIEKIMA